MTSLPYERLDPLMWRPQPRLRVSIDSRQQLNSLNERGGIAVFLDVPRSSRPDIQIIGSQNKLLSFWETRSCSGFLTKPKFSAGLITLRFVIDGNVEYLRREGNTVVFPSIAALTGFDDLMEVSATGTVSSLSATMQLQSLVSANFALRGEDNYDWSELAPLADMTKPGMAALFCTVRSVQQRLQSINQDTDFLLPLLQELMCYQLISAWPKRTGEKIVPLPGAASRQLRLAIDYIESNLPTALTLAGVAAAAGISVRSLQVKFKKELGRTPIQFIIDRRLTRAHEELRSFAVPERSVGDIARAWGFAHMGDFGQRYRRLFGVTPSQTRLDARREHFSASR